MTPKDKAKEIVFAYYPIMSEDGIFRIKKHEAKQCALIEVCGIISEIGKLRKPEYTIFIEDRMSKDGYERLNYWQEVKTEIEAMI